MSDKFHFITYLFAAGAHIVAGVNQFMCDSLLANFITLPLVDSLDGDWR